MAQSNFGFTTMGGYIDRLREEADRKAEEEKRKKEEEARRQSMTAWRRDVPVGPPTQEQSMSDLTRGNAGNFSKPVDRAQISLPQQQPSQFQVGPTMPGVDTSTPQIGNTQTYQPTVGIQPNEPSRQDEPSRQKPAPSISDRTRGNIAPITPASPPSSQGQWNPSLAMPPQNTGSATSILPGLFTSGAVPELLNMGKNLIQSGEIPLPGQGQLDRWGTTMDMFEAQVDDRWDENKYKSIIPKNAGDILALPSNIGGAILNVGGTLLDFMGLGSQLVNDTSFGEEGITAGMRYAQAMRTGSLYREYQEETGNANDKWVAQFFGLGELDEETNEALNRSVFANLANLMGFLDPSTWKDVNNLGNLWYAAEKDLLSSFAPTEEQLKNNTPEEIAAAKSLAVYNSYSSVSAMEATFDEVLDNQTSSRKKMEDARRLAELADQSVGTLEQKALDALYAEAGMASAEAVRLRDKTHLEIYYDHFNPWTALPIMAATDPLNAWGILTELLRLTPAARRAAQGSEIINIGVDAVAGKNKRLIDYVKDNPLIDFMKTGRSKSRTASHDVFAVSANVLSGLSTKGDLAVALKGLFDGTAANGISMDLLNGADAAIQAADGIYPMGKSGINDFRFQEAIKLFTGLADDVANFPSLIGEATDVANKMLVQGDILGALIRRSAQTFEVSRFGEIPAAAVKFELVNTAGNKAVVNLLDNKKNLVGTTAEMSLREATTYVDRMQKAVLSGEEFTTNWARWAADLRRNIQSTYSININPGNLVMNAVSGNMTPFFDLPDPNHHLFDRLDEGLEYILAKEGGMYPTARLAEEVGKIGFGTGAASQGTVPTGQYDNWLGKILNFTTAGLAKKGKELRQGLGEIGGFKTGEAGMASSVFYAAYRSLFEQEWGRRLPDMMEQLLGTRVSDPKVKKWMVDNIMHIGMNGGREDVAKAFQDIANGKISMSMRSISPYGAELFQPGQITRIDNILKNVTIDNLNQATAELVSIFEERRQLMRSNYTKFISEIQPSFTRADDAADTADVMQQLKRYAKMAGVEEDAVTQRGPAIKSLFDNVNQEMLVLMQQVQNNPQYGKYIMNVWAQIQDAKDVTRRKISEFATPIHEYIAFNPAGPNLSNESITKAYLSLYDFTNAKWDEFSQEARVIMDKARNGILDGSVQRAAEQGILGMIPGEPSLNPDFRMVDLDIMEVLADQTIDPQVALNVLKHPISAKDPAFSANLGLFRQTTDALVERMMAMVMRYPTVESFDEFNNAMREVSHQMRIVLGKIEGIKAAQRDPANMADPAKLRELAAQGTQVAKYGWNKYWKYAIERFSVASYRIAEANYGPEVFEALNFQRFKGDKTWKLLWQDIQMPKRWRVADELGNETFMQVGPNAIPNSVIDEFNRIRQVAQTEVADQLGRLGLQGFVENPGVDVDKALAALGGNGIPEMTKKVRENISKAMAVYKNPQVVTPADLPNWYLEKLDATQLSMTQSLHEVAMANAQGYGRLGLDAISDFNRNILPLFDDIKSGARHYGQQMTSIGMVDFTNEYHPDVLLGLYAPYHYWFSRMAKNALERQIFDPRVSQRITMALLSGERANRGNDEPNRNVQAGPGRVNIGDNAYGIGMNLLTKWIPHWPTMAGNGWVDPSMANQAYQYITDSSKEAAFPDTAKGWVGYVAMAHQLAQSAGLSSYNEYDDIVSWMMGEPVTKKDFQGFLGEQSGLFRAMGYGALGFANWARENNMPFVARAADAVAWAGAPNYTDSLVARQVALNATKGKPDDAAATMALDKIRQGYSGLEPYPEEGMIAPNVNQDLMAAQNTVSMEYFVKSLISWATGATVTTNYGGEKELNEAKEMKANMAYNERTNPAGSQSAYFSMTDPESENYVQGLATWEDRYAATAETAPQMDDRSIPRPGEDVVTAKYYDEVRAVKDKYTDEIQATYEAHPEWKGTTNKGILGDIKAYNDDVKARLDEELADIDEKYPSVDKTYGEKTPWSLYGARPSETLEEAQDRLVNQAYANVENLHPEKGDGSNLDWDVYNAALEEELNRLYNDPTAASDVVFGRALPQREEKPPVPTADILRETGSPTSAPAGTSGTTAPVTQVPTNPYAEQMATAEQEYGLPAGLLQEVARNESGFDPNAKSSAGALGVMQIMPDTWEEWAPKVGVTDIMDPASNIAVSAAYLGWLMNTLPEEQRDIRSVMTAYNWGIGNVLEKGVDAAPPETTAYSNTIASALDAGVNVGAPPAQPQVQQGESFTNPNWGDKIGKWTVVGDPITDTGLTWVSPVPAGTEVYQYYGETDVDGLGNYYASKNQGFGHEGVDWMLPEGTDVGSIAEGTVVFVGDGKDEGRPAYGYMVVVEHPNGMKSRYGHLSGFAVEVGDTVTPGQVVGYVGHTPTTANIGDHLHLSVESPYENTGPYRTVDPFRLIGQGGAAPQVASVSQTQQTGTQAASVPPATGNNIAFTKTPEQMLDDARTRGKAPAQVEAQQATSDAFQAVRDRATAAYPKYAKLYDDYAKLPEEERDAWREANPIMKAMSLAGWNPDEYAYLEKTFGKGIVEKWASIPPYVEGDTGARADYYRKYPTVFLAKAWIDGRPEPYVEDLNPDPYAEYTRDFGADYETAKEMFGEGIWGVVEQYYRTPKYVKGGDNTAWLAFKEAHPEYDQWREWWYALMGDSASTSNFNQYGSGWSGGYSGKGWKSSGSSFNQVNPIRTPAPGKPPAWRGSDSSGDWRKYLSLGDNALKTWRR